MTARTELGPLWEQEPKTSGFRMSIPNPVSLLEWAKEIASEHGDLTVEQIKEKTDAHLRREAASGEVKKLFPNEKVWKIDIEDKLFSNVRVELSAGYSSKSGEWADLVCYLAFSENALMHTLDYYISSMTPEITERLRTKGLFKCIAEKKDKQNTIRISANQDSPEAVACLYYESPEDAIQADPDDPMFNLWLIVYQGKMSLQLIDGLSSLQNFQHTVSHFVDSLYETLQMEPPNSVFELSEETELT